MSNMTTKKLIIAALLKLDPTDDSVWTNEGLPKIESLKIQNLTREDITNAAPNFNRTNPKIEKDEEKKKVPQKDKKIKLEKEILEIENKTNELSKQKAKLVKELDTIIIELNDLGVHNNQITLMSFIKTQQENRIKEAEKAKKVNEALAKVMNSVE